MDKGEPVTLQAMVHVRVAMQDVDEAAEIKREFQLDGDSEMDPIDIAREAVDLVYEWARKVIQE